MWLATPESPGTHRPTLATENDQYPRLSKNHEIRIDGMRE
jgi:hypothetical protein